MSSDKVESDVDAVIRLLKWCNKNGVIASSLKVGDCTISVAAVETQSRQSVPQLVLGSMDHVGPVDLSKTAEREPKDFYDAHKLRKLKKASSGSPVGG